MNVGVIGLGAIGPLHINALVRAGQNVRALCDLEPEKCARINRTFALSAAVYTDYRGMLEKEHLDAVHICTPHYLHAEMICEALKRGIHVLSEKPLAISEEQLSLIEQEVKRGNAQLGVCFQNRFNPSVLYAREVLKGRSILSASASLVWERDAAYYAQGAWRGTKAMEGGGVMINQSIHGLDLMQWMCGMPKCVLAHVSNVSLRGVIEVEDTAFGLFRLENGGNFVLTATNAAKHSFLPHYSFFTGDKSVELIGDNLIVNGKFVTKEGGLPLFAKEEWGTGHVRLIQNFYECLAAGKRFSVGFYEARRAVCLVLAMYRSGGEEVSLPAEK